MYSSVNKKLPRHFTPSQTFYLQLTQTQAKTLAFLLPKGCTILHQPKTKPKSLPKPKQQINPYSSAAFQNSAKINLSHQNYLQSHPKQPSNKQPPKPQPQKPKLPPKQEIPQALKPMIPILQQLKSHKHAWPFLDPVDAETLGIPEYYQIVKEPMDLSKVESKLKSAKYSTPQEFYRDINLMIKNSYLFNSANQQFLKLTGEFERYFWRIAGPQSKPANDKKLEREKEKQRERLEKQRIREEKIREKLLEKEREKERKLLLQQQQQAQLALKLAKKKKKFIPKDMLQAQNISVQEKQQLANNIHALSKEHLKGIRQIVFASDKQQEGSTTSSNPVNKPTNIHEFDIEKIGFKKIRELQKYVRIKLAEMQNTKSPDQMVEKKNQIDLDQVESQWTQEFVQ